MDFFVSKVAMSICALLVVVILAGVTDKDRFLKSGDEIGGVLDEFCEVADRVHYDMTEGAVLWTVPSLSTGESIELVLGHGMICCKWDGRSIVREPQCCPHVWRWDGSAMNETLITEHDACSADLKIRSGDSILLKNVYVTLENDQRLLVFASSQTR